MIIFPRWEPSGEGNGWFNTNRNRATQFAVCAPCSCDGEGFCDAHCVETFDILADAQTAFPNAPVDETEEQYD